jgi:hypothetical protein
MKDPSILSSLVTKMHDEFITKGIHLYQRNLNLIWKVKYGKFAKLVHSIKRCRLSKQVRQKD